MSGENFTFNDPPGTLLVKSLDGQSAFDSRLPTQRIYMTGSADVQGPANTSIQATTFFVPFGKVFPKIPYLRSAARLIDNISGNQNFGQGKDYWPPSMGWTRISTTGQQFFGGNYTAANTNGVYLGNGWQNGAPRGRLRFLYGVFENPVE